MINKRFKKNWLKILNFNENRELLKDLDKIQNYVRIPLSPIKLNTNILYNLFEFLYPKFINDQQNILDVIISEKEKRNKVVESYLYKTEKAGIHQNLEKLPEGLVKIKRLEFEKMDDIFNKIQTKILKEKDIRISSIRIFKEKAIGMINEHCEKIEKISINDFLERLLDLIQKVFEQDLFIIYPEPIIFKFVSYWIKLLNEIRLKSTFNFIAEILPKCNTALLINGNNIKIVVQMQNLNSKSGKSELKLKFFIPHELGIDINDLTIVESLWEIKNKLKTDNTYYFNQQDIVSFISDSIRLLIPLEKEKLKLLIQKTLFGYRSFERHWNMIPRPKIYNTLIRFLIKLFGFNINLRKISHWAIPDIIFNYLDFNFGLNSRILLIITDLKDKENLKISREKIPKNVCKETLILEIEESTLIRLEPINKQVVFSSNCNSLSSIRDKTIGEYGIISAIIVIDKLLLQNFLKSFIVDHSRFSFFPRFKTLKLLRNEKYFMIFPEFPFYKLIKKKRSLSLLRLLLPILIDKHEF